MGVSYAGHNTNQSVTYRVDEKPTYIAGSNIHNVFDITNVRMPVKLETGAGISSKSLGNGNMQYTVKPAKKGSTFDSYNQILCVKTGTVIYGGGYMISELGASLTAKANGTLKVIPTIAMYTNGQRQSEWLNDKGRWSEFLIDFSNNIIELPKDDHIYYGDGVYMSKYRVMVIRTDKDSFYYDTPEQYNEYCKMMPILY